MNFPISILAEKNFAVLLFTSSSGATSRGRKRRSSRLFQNLHPHIDHQHLLCWHDLGNIRGYVDGLPDITLFRAPNIQYFGDHTAEKFSMDAPLWIEVMLMPKMCRHFWISCWDPDVFFTIQYTWKIVDWQHYFGDIRDFKW